MAAAMLSIGALGQGHAPVSVMIQDYIALSAKQCDPSHLAGVHEKWKALPDYQQAQLRAAERVTCECMPGKANILLNSLSGEERERSISSQEFEKEYGPRIVNQCAAQQARSQYERESCPAEWARVGVKNPHFCSCMTDRLRDVPDAELAQLGSDSSDWLAKVQEAKSKRLPEPPKPPSVSRYQSFQSSCAKPQ